MKTANGESRMANGKRRRAARREWKKTASSEARVEKDGEQRAVSGEWRVAKDGEWPMANRE
jgi:hypothetical protein